MAFIVEDGTGKADANSYLSVAGADAYFADRGVSGWSGTNEEKQGWLVQATDYIDGRFGGRFLGRKQFTDDPEQALEFPRIGIPGMPTNMPRKLLQATAEYALRAKSAPLAPDLEIEANGLVQSSKTEKVGPIEESTGYMALGTSNAPVLLRPYPAADMLLRQLLKGLNNGRVIRN